MTKQAKPEKAHRGAWPFALPNVSPSVEAQSRAWLEGQAELVEHTQEMMAGWMKRRQEAVESLFHALRELNGCRDLTGAAAVYNEWLNGSMRRAMADMNEAREEGLKLIEIGQRSLAGLASREAQGGQAAKEGERRAAAE